MQVLLSPDQFVLVVLLIKLGVVSALASVLVRFGAFRDILFSETLGRRERLNLVLLLGGLLTIGVAIRLIIRYDATDLSLAGTLLGGLIGGRLAGSLIGAMVGGAAFAGGEYLALPLGLLYGLSGGFLHHLQPSKRVRMDVSPFPLLILYRFSKDWVKYHRANWNIIPLGLCVGLEGLRLTLAYRWGFLFALGTGNPLVLICILAATASCLGIPLKIWNNTWMELELRDKEARLTEAKLRALTYQINPHFLFNTLNTISASIRVDPERARFVVLKLSQLLRSLLRSQREFKTLERELELIESYLAIEQIRFGPEKLRVEKEIDPESLSCYVPSMLLQPLVENSLKHGLGGVVRGGFIRIKTAFENGRVLITVEDNGAGIPPERLERVMELGIGLSNLDERLKAVYGKDYRFTVENRPEGGTRATLLLLTLTPEGETTGSGRTP
ncbi:MAG: sensor histidine kinase [Nitrospinota bacterium]